jgi:hypothetical protein
MMRGYHQRTIKRHYGGELARLGRIISWIAL